MISPERARQLVNNWQDDPVDAWRTQQRQAQFVTAGRRRTQQLTRAAVASVRERLASAGHRTDETTHSCPFDLWVANTLRVEVKAANWTRRASRPGHGRYQACVKPHQVAAADVLIFAVKNDRWHYFVIPTAKITSKTLEITQRDPLAYAGRWAIYYDAWDVLEQALKKTKNRPHQLSF